MYQIYQITHKASKEYYVGIHKGDVYKDDYWGSGVRIKNKVSKWGTDYFDKDLISEYESKDLALWVEKMLVRMPTIEDDLCLNVSMGGHSPMDGLKHKEESRHKISKANTGPKHWNYGSNISPESCEKISKFHTGRKRPNQSKMMKGNDFAKRRKIVKNSLNGDKELFDSMTIACEDAGTYKELMGYHLKKNGFYKTEKGKYEYL